MLNEEYNPPDFNEWLEIRFQRNTSGTPNWVRRNFVGKHCQSTMPEQSWERDEPGADMLEA